MELITLYINNDQSERLATYDVDQRFDSFCFKQVGIGTAMLIKFNHREFAVCTSEFTFGRKSVYDLMNSETKMCTLPKRKWCFPYLSKSKALAVLRRAISPSLSVKGDELNRALLRLSMFHSRIELTPMELANVKQVIRKYGYNCRRGLFGGYYITTSISKVVKGCSIELLNYKLPSLEMQSYVDNIGFQNIEV